MSHFSSGKRFTLESKSKKQELVGKVEDIKSAPQAGEKRVIVRDEKGRRRMVAVDLSAKHTSKMERKEKYAFEVQEKDDTRYGYRAKKTTGFKTYHADDMPEKVEGDYRRQKMFSRFNGGNKPSKVKFSTH